MTLFLAAPLVMKDTVLALAVGVLMFSVYQTHLTSALWVVPDSHDPLPGTPYTLRSLEAASSRPLMGTFMDVTEPDGFAERMASDDGTIATIVFHIDVLDDVPTELVRHHFERGMHLSLIGGGTKLLVDWLGMHEDDSEYGIEDVSWHNYDLRTPDEPWPIATMGCRSGALHPRSLGGPERWITPAQLVERVAINRCNDRRLALLRQLDKGTEQLEIAAESAWFSRDRVGNFLYDRDRRLVDLAVLGEPYDLPTEITELMWTRASVSYPLVVLTGGHTGFSANTTHVYDLAHEELILTYDDLLPAVVRDWAAIGGEELVAWDDVVQAADPPTPAIVVTSAAYDPQERLLGFVTRTCLAHDLCYAASGFRQLDTGDIHLIRAVAGIPRLLTWSPDGSAMSYAVLVFGETSASDTIHVDSVVEHQEVVDSGSLAGWEGIPDDAMISGLEWTEDGQQLLVTVYQLETMDESLWLFDLASGVVEPADWDGS